MYLWWNLCTLYVLIEWCTAGGICVPCMYSHWRMYRWWNLCTLYVLSLMYCWWNLCTMYFTLIEGCTAGGICVPCMYSHWRMYRWWNLCTLYVLSLNDILLVEFVYFVFTLMQGESYNRWPQSEFDCPEVSLCGWQDIKIQLLLLLCNMFIYF